MNTFGKTIGLTIFGESHGLSIGAVLDGLPSGEAIDWERIKCRQLAQKKMPLKSKAAFSTAIRRGRRCVLSSVTVTNIPVITTSCGISCGLAMPITPVRYAMAASMTTAAAVISRAA